MLFDLDGTLTRSGGAGSRALGEAVHARPRAGAELRKMRLDGMTDRAIARALLAAEGNQAIALDRRMREVTEAEIDTVLVRYLDALARECGRNAYEALPGVAALLQRLRARADVLLGLCTGNLARGAELKLTCAGLWGGFRFGGYGSDAEPRADIVRMEENAHLMQFRIEVLPEYRRQGIGRRLLGLVVDAAERENRLNSFQDR